MGNETMVNAMTRDEMFKEARKSGYIPTTGFLKCPVCESRMYEAAQTMGILDPLPPWMNPVTATRFFPSYKGHWNCNKPVRIACPCGWRSTPAKNTYVDNSVKCNGMWESKPCTSTLTSKDIEGGYTQCTKCRNKAGIPVEKARVTCDCGVVLPKGRKQYCHTCWPINGKRIVTKDVKEEGFKATMQ